MARPHTPTVLAALTRRLLVVAAEAGLPAPDVSQYACLAASDQDPDARIGAEVHWRLWESVVSAPSPPGFGLLAGGRFRPEHYGVVGLAMLRCRTLGDALTHLERYAGLIGENLPCMEQTARHLVLRSVLRPRVARMPQVSDCVAVDAYRVLSFVLGRAPALKEVRLQRARPSETSAHRLAFGSAPISFQSAETALVLDRSVLDLALPQSDPALYRYLARHADALMERLPRGGSAADEVRRILPELLHAGEPSVATLAQALGRGARTLQRSLQSEGTCLSDLIDEARRELALLYLRERDMAIGEIAFLLGYSEPSAFHRAFRRWTNQTPQECRAELDASPGRGGESPQLSYARVA